MEHIVNTAVIGGGPAGLSCAIRLQKRGVTNLVIEKKSYPREKTCAGLVTEKTMRLLSEILEVPDETRLPDLFCDSTNQLSLSDNNQTLTNSTLSKPFHLVKRKHFDAFLAAWYQKNGGYLLQNTCCTAVDLPGKTLHLSNGDTVRFRHLVVADGALSPTRKMLGYPPVKLGFCVETFVQKSKLPNQTGITIDLGVVPKGYAWIFPSGNEWCVGVCGVYQKKIAFDGLLKKYLELLGVHPQTCALKGAFLPRGKIKRPGKKREDVLFVGDAGGFVDPIYGEGLFFALGGGLAAADAIAERPANANSEFCRRTKDHVTAIRQGYRLQKIFFGERAQKRFKKIIQNRNAFVAFYIDHQISEYDYPYSKFFKLCRDYKKSKKK